MIVLDTDHLSLLDRAPNAAANQLLARLAMLAPDELATSVVTYEEQTRGWLALMNRAKSVAQQVDAYARLLRHLENYKRIPVIPFDAAAATEFQRLQHSRIRIGTMDLKIAAIAVRNRATLLSRNLVDFRKVPDLDVQDWTV